jgi:hypothetical protein
MTPETAGFALAAAMILASWAIFSLAETPARRAIQPWLVRLAAWARLDGSKKGAAGTAP